MEINSKDLKALAILVNKTMHSVEFPEERAPISYSRKTLRLLDSFEEKYKKEPMIDSVREAVKGISGNKLQFYKTAHKLLKKVNDRNGERTWPSNVTFETIYPMATVTPMRLSA
ncbi:MAG: hypothetical protein KTR32_02080 [Granulosicoccus sp.]|nr:hypothetical protein [Granulosicoccus sp.]